MNKKKWILIAAALVALALIAVLLVSWFGGGSGVKPGKPGNTAFGTDEQQTGSESGDTASADTDGKTDVSVPDITVDFGVAERDEDWDEPDVPTAQKPTQPQTTPATQPDQTQDTTVSTEPPEQMTYERFEFHLSPEEQYAFIQSFSPPEEFIHWYNAAREAYEATQNDYTLDPNDPEVDFGDLTGNQP